MKRVNDFEKCIHDQVSGGNHRPSIEQESNYLNESLLSKIKRLHSSETRVNGASSGGEWTRLLEYLHQNLDYRVKLYRWSSLRDNKYKTSLPE